MSFSSEVKAELCRTALSRRCCAQAEAYGVLLYCNQFTASQVRISTESTAFAARLPALFHRAFQLSFDRTPEKGASKQIFSITEPDKLSALWSAFGHEPAGTLAHHINFAVLEEEHCRLAFFRGAFLAGGSVTDPAKRYHLELSTPHLSVSRELRALLLECGFTPKETTRKANSITYFKQSEAIEDFLTAIGAPLAAMEIMNAKAEKDLRGSINRRVNCDAANLDKAVDAAQGTSRPSTGWRSAACWRSCPTSSRRRWIAGGPPGAHPGPACGAVRTARLQIRVQPPPAQADGDGQGVGRERKERVDCHGEASGSKALEADFLGPYGGGCCAAGAGPGADAGAGAVSGAGRSGGCGILHGSVYCCDPSSGVLPAAARCTTRPCGRRRASPLPAQSAAGSWR